MWAANGEGVARAGELCEDDTVSFRDEYVQEAAPPHRVGVAMYLPRGDRLPFALAKLTEVGVDDIYPLVGATDRRSGKGPSVAGTARMERIVREAAVQSERLWLPRLHEVARVEEFVKDHVAEIAVCAKGGAGVVESKHIWMIGPESGQIPDVDDLVQVTLGETILRMETAAVVAGALLVAIRAGIVTPRP